MRRKIFGFIIALGVALSASAKGFVVENFDNIAVGTKWTVWGEYGPGSTTATVIADPKNANNHVLRVQVKNWGVFPEFILPQEYAGAKLTQRFSKVRFRFYRTANDQNDWKQMHVLYGSDELFCDDGYPHQGDKSVWQQREYALKHVPGASTATALRLGIHSEASDYYIDDVELASEIDDYETIESGKLDISGNNTSSSYVTYQTPIYIPEGQQLSVYTSRYTNFDTRVAGPGTLNLYCGGERTFLGNQSTKKYQDWPLFTGDVHIRAYKDKTSNAGFYGLIMLNNGKTFTPGDVEDALKSGKVCRIFSNSSVTLHNGATLAFEGGTYAAQYGNLTTESGTRIYAYYKNTDNKNAYLIVGNLGLDATMAGTIAPFDNKKTQALGLIKQGEGTYTLTANDNLITGSLRIMQGRVDICNDAAKAQSSKLSGGTGSTNGTTAVALVFGNGVLGGTGNVGGAVENYGTIEPGTAAAPGTLQLRDFTTAGKAVDLTMHPGSTVRVKVSGAESYDCLDVSGAVTFSNITEDFENSEKNPRIKVVLNPDCTLSVGTEFTILKAKSSNCTWDMVYPSRYTWESELKTLADGTYALVIRVTSLENDPANQGNDDGPTTDPEDEEDETMTFGADGDTHSLRYYANLMGKKIGVAIPAYDINMWDTSDKRANLVKKDFNMLVPENCMKFESTEPSQNGFTFGDADNLVNVAQNYNFSLRGHTLAWYSQVAQWVSVDGKKNDKGWTKPQLMAILKNHILTVVGRYKGKITEWDVVNECLDDDQSIVNTNPSGYTLRKESVWTKVCGEEYIDSAFVWAHQADPDCKLYLNDYDNEFKGKAKTEAFYNLAKRLKNSGIPIDGVGFQCHFDAGAVSAKKLRANLDRYEELGLETAITELDLGYSDNTEENRQQQARDYYRIVKAAMESPTCNKVMIWGVLDGMSWRTGRHPLLFNDDVTYKPAYYAVRQALRECYTGIEEVTSDVSSPVVRREYFTANGTRISRPQSGVVVVREHRADGTLHSYKVLK